MKPSLIECEKLGLELARARTAKGITQRQVARAARICGATVSYVETGARVAPPDLLKAYARLCDLNLNRLLLSWCYVPDSLLVILRAKPEICDQILEAR